MFKNVYKYLVLGTIMAALLCPAVPAQSTPDPCSGQGADLDLGYKGISKVRPSSSQVLKVRPYAGVDGISRWNPLNWGSQCCLPTPAKKQFVVDTRVWFARLNGEVKRGGPGITGAMEPSLVDFDDHLGLSRSGNTLLTFSARYQFQPRWAIRYSFTPISMSGARTPNTSFNFFGRNFTSGSNVLSKWDRYEHRTGLVFDLSRTVSGATSVFAEWLNVQDKLTVGETLGPAASVTWSDVKNMAVLGIEFNKCLKNYRGNTLALSCRGGVAFLDDNFGYDAEASLSYLIPVKTGRFGFVKGGYRYAQIKKETDAQLFSTTMDGAFVELGFLF